MRNGWGEPGGKLVTRKEEFRDHQTSFALHQLPILFLETTVACADFLDDAGVTGSDADGLGDRIAAVAQGIAKIGNVPLVHAHEWNLTPSGPLPPVKPPAPPNPPRGT